MKRLFIGIAATASIIFGGLYLVRSYIGDVRPALLPIPQTDTNNNNQVTTAITKPLTTSESPAISAERPTGLRIPDGFQIGIFAKNLGAARDLEFSPDGTLFVSVPASGVVTALPDRNNDGTADEAKTIITGLRNTHGLAFYNGDLFIAAETAVYRYSWNEATLLATLEKKLFDLPAGGRHFTRTIAFNKKGEIFVSIGSTCDVCVEKNPWLASVIVSDTDGNNPRLFAKGLRNAVFIEINTDTDELWGTEMGRDFLGDEAPPDEINIVKDGKDYGWPICYGDSMHDTQFDKNQYIADPCRFTENPIYKIPAHSAPLGLAFIKSAQFPSDWQGDLLVAYHGSWNRSVPTGYKVVRIKLKDVLYCHPELVSESGTTDTCNGNMEEDFLTGFLKDNTTIGRPVDLLFDHEGSLFLSDDKTGVVYKIVHMLENTD